MSVLSDLLEKRDAAQAELDELFGSEESAETRSFSPEQEERATVLIAEIKDMDARLDEESAKVARSNKLAEQRKLAGIGSVDTKVTNEPTTYGPGSPHSYYHDLARQSLVQSVHHAAAVQRLSRHSFEMAREAHLGTEIGRRAERQMKDVTRSDSVAEHRASMDQFRAVGQAEFRTPLTTGGGASASASGGSAAALVAPFVIGDYVPFREAGRTAADLVSHRDLPDYGMQLYIPNVTSGAAVASQTEGSAVQETDPAFGYLNAAIITEAGEVTVSQQVLDRAGPGFEADQVIADALRRDLAPKIDAYVLTQMLSGATNINDNTNTWAVTKTSGTGGLYGKLSNAKQNIRTATGTFLNPNAALMTPARWEVTAGAADSQGRPFVVPDAMGPFNAIATASGTGDVGVEGRTGYTLNTLPIYQDFNIPAPASGNDQVIVLDSDIVVLYEGAPINRAIPQTLGNHLQVIIQLYQYLAVHVFYPGGIVSLTGTFFAAPSYS